MKKRIFCKRDVFQRKFSFSKENSLFTNFCLNLCGRVNKPKNGIIGSVTTFRRVQRSRRRIRSGKKVKRELSLEKNSWISLKTF